MALHNIVCDSEDEEDDDCEVQAIPWFHSSDSAQTRTQAHAHWESLGPQTISPVEKASDDAQKSTGSTGMMCDLL